jgi:hypothetical protein
MPRDTKYGLTYVDQGAKWTWRIEITPAGSEIPETWDTVEIEGIGIESLSDFDSGFDSLPFGAEMASSVKISFNLVNLPRDLAKYLVEPFIADEGEIALEWTANGATQNYSRNFDLCNTVLISTNRGSGSTLVPVFRGAQKRTMPSKRTFAPDGIFVEIEFLEIGKLALENVFPADIQARMLKGAADGEYQCVSTTSAFEIAFRYNRNHTIYSLYISSFTNASPVVFLQYYKITDIDKGICSLVDAIVKAWTRDNADFVIAGSFLDAFVFFERSASINELSDYDINIDARGDEIPSSDLWFIGGAVFNEAERFIAASNVAGFLFETKDDKGIFEYDSAWDYYVDAVEAYCMKMLIRSGTNITVYFRKILESDSSNSLEYTEFQCTEFGDEPAGETIRKAIANLNIDNDYDVDEWSESVAGSASEQSIEIKPPFHNLLQTFGTDNWRVFKNSTAITIYSEKTQLFSINKLYYFDDNYMLDPFPIKVHEQMQINTGLAVYDYFYSIHTLAILWFMGVAGAIIDGDVSNLNRALLYLQSYANTALAACKTYIQLFSKYNQTVSEPEIDLDARFVPFATGDVFDFANENRFGGYYFSDLAEDLFDNVPENAILTKATISPESGSVKCKFVCIEG